MKRKIVAVVMFFIVFSMAFSAISILDGSIDVHAASNKAIKQMLKIVLIDHRRGLVEKRSRKLVYFKRNLVDFIIGKLYKMQHNQKTAE